MPSPTILLAGALVPEGWLLRERFADALAHALPASWSTWAVAPLHDESVPGEAVPRELAHDRWLRRTLPGLPAANAVLASARALRIAQDAAPDAPARPADAWRALPAWTLQPIHLMFATDHLVPVDGALDDLDDASARALADAAAPLFAAHGATLSVPSAGLWLVDRPTPAAALSCASFEAVAGRSVEAWLPAGADARAFHRLLNDVQMTWFAHPVNAAREAAGAPVVNGLWPGPPVDGATLARLGLHAPSGPGGGHRFDVDDGRVVLDTRLLAARLRDDPAHWLERLPAVLADAAAADPAAVVVCGDRHSRALQPQAPSWRQSLRAAWATWAASGRRGGAAAVPPSARPDTWTEP